MTAKKRILAFEIGTFFTRYVVFEDGRMGIPGTIATPVDGEEPFYQAGAANPSCRTMLNLSNT